MAAKLATKDKPSPSSLCRWKLRYLKAGEDVRALVDNHVAKGNRSRRYAAEVETICRDAIEARYLVPQRGTIQKTLDEALYRVSAENRLRPQHYQLKHPTRRLLKRLIMTIPSAERHAARYGRDAARKAYRSIKGHIATQAPLDRAEIDHTVLDLIALDDETGLSLGRPTLTVCLDVHTRCILGVYIGFIQPSFLTVAKCLKHCWVPKLSLRDDFPEIKTEWPAYGVMRELILDNGLEFHSRSLEQVCLTLGVTMTFSPRREPWFKPHIERFFGTFNRGFSHTIPGTTFGSIGERGDYKSANQASMPISEVKKLVMKWIVDIYHQEVHRGIGMSPAQKWRTTADSFVISLPDETTHLDAVMGSVHKRVLSHKGIEYERLFFNSPELADHLRQRGSNQEVEIRVDEDNLGTIFVVFDLKSSPLRVPCLDQAYAKGLTLWRHKVIRRNMQEVSGQHDPSALLEAKNSLNESVYQATKQARKSAGKHLGRFRESTDSAAKAASEDQAPLSSLSLNEIEANTAVAEKRQGNQGTSEQALNRSSQTHRPKLKPIYKRVI